jgi:hypothetical protein
VGEVLERTVRRIEKHLRRRGLLVDDEGVLRDTYGDADPESNLAASAVSGQGPPAGPQWKHGLQPLEAHALAYDEPLCASLRRFSLHAATRAGALDREGREALWPAMTSPIGRDNGMRPSAPAIARTKRISANRPCKTPND